MSVAGWERFEYFLGSLHRLRLQKRPQHRAHPQGARPRLHIRSSLGAHSLRVDRCAHRSCPKVKATPRSNNWFTGASPKLAQIGRSKSQTQHRQPCRGSDAAMPRQCPIGGHPSRGAEAGALLGRPSRAPLGRRTAPIGRHHTERHALCPCFCFPPFPRPRRSLEPSVPSPPRRRPGEEHAHKLAVGAPGGPPAARRRGGALQVARGGGRRPRPGACVFG